MNNKVLLGGAAAVFLGLAILGYGFMRNSKEQAEVRDLQKVYQDNKQTNLEFRQQHETIIKDFSREKETWKKDRETLAVKLDEVTSMLGKVVHDRDYLKQAMGGFQQELENLATRMKSALDRPDFNPSITKTSAQEKKAGSPPPVLPQDIKDMPEEKKGRLLPKLDDPGLEGPTPQ